MPKQPVTAASSEASVGEDSMMAEARQIIAAHDRSEMGEAKPRSPNANNSGNKDKKKVARQPPKQEANSGNDAAAKNAISELDQHFADQDPQSHAQRNKNNNREGSPSSDASSAAQTARVRNHKPNTTTTNHNNNNNTKTKTNKTRNTSSKNRNRIVVDVSGSDIVKAQAAAAAAAASSSPSSARTDHAANMEAANSTSPSNNAKNDAAHFNDSGEFPGDHSAATISAGNKSPRRVQQQGTSPPSAPTTTSSIPEADEGGDVDDSTLNGALNPDDDDNDASSATDLIQAASRDSNSNMRRSSPQATSDVSPTGKINRMNKARNHAKANPNKQNVTIVGEPTSADASIDGSTAQRSTASDAALNGEDRSGRTSVTDSTDSVKEASISAATATASSRTSPTKHSSPKVASPLSVQSVRSPLSSPDSQRSQRQMGPTKATSPLSVQSAQSPLSSSKRASASDVVAAIAPSADALNRSTKGSTASDIVAAIASAAEDHGVRTSPSDSLRNDARSSNDQSIGDTPLRGSGNRSVASVAAHTTASAAASRRSDARVAATVPSALSPTMSSPHSFSNKDIIQDNIENGGHSAMTNGEARTFDNEPKPIYRDERTFVQRNRKVLLLGFGLVAIVAAIIGIAVAASSKRSNTSDADSFMGTPAPTPFLTLEALLSTWSPDGGVAMKTLPFSPQSIAYAWIKADLQTLGYDPDDLSGYDDSVAAFEPRRMADRVKTRYALSVLNYTFWGGSGAGVSTDTFDAWSHENDECNFARVSCEYDGEGNGDGLVRVLDFYEAGIPEGSVLPGEVTMLNDLNALIFTSTRLGGKIPDVFSPMQDLRVLDLDDCVFTGSVPESIAALVNLEELRLNDNILEGPLPDLFWNLSFLRVLELQKNLFTGTISQSIWSLGPSLEDLRIGDNKLTGTLSTQIGKLGNLERLWVYTNQLTGKIPTEIGKLTFLNDLAMDDNRFVGAIPKQLASCPLTELWLNANRLSSSIPASLGEIFGLENLYLDENLLTGTVPSQLGNLYNCTDLFLNNNKLSGKVPATLGDIESLERLRLHANSLTGAVPSSLCALGLDQLTADCADLPQLGVLISCPMGCCTECY